MSNNNAFSIRSRNVTARFLQSAVVVDDRAHLGPEPQARALVTPGRGPRAKTEEKSEPPQNDLEALTNALDAKQLIDSFAELGIVCAVLKPDLGLPDHEFNEHSDTIESLSIRTNNATKRADIVILDWNIPKETQRGENAKRLIRKILETDDLAPRTDDHSRRLRLIAIYTGELDLQAITDDVSNLLQHLDIGEIRRSSPFRASAGSVTVAVYGKEKPTIGGVDAERRLSESKLPERLRNEFSEMTAGLLSNTALEALSTIRTNTHRILSRFNPGVDAPYVAHRAMIQPPEEAEEHPVPLIASEIEGILAEDTKISQLVGLEAIKEWLDTVDIGSNYLQVELQMSIEEFKNVFLSLLELGLGKSTTGSDSLKWKELTDRLRNNDRTVAGSITKLLSSSEPEGSERDMEFARLTSLRSQYDAPPPTLKLGAIVVKTEGSDRRYWLCVQPVCDSVRIDSTRSFPFLKLIEKPADSTAPFDFVVLDQGEHRRFRYSRRVFDMTLFKMRADKNTKSVTAHRNGDDWLFDGTENTALRWVADLKAEHAHRVVDEFVNGIKRVGLTESEWLRRMATTNRSPSGSDEQSPSGSEGEGGHGPD